MIGAPDPRPFALERACRKPKDRMPTMQRPSFTLSPDAVQRPTAA